MKKEWTITDIKKIEYQLTDEQCQEVLQLGADYDKNVGANGEYWCGLIEDYLETKGLLDPDGTRLYLRWANSCNLQEEDEEETPEETLNNYLSEMGILG